MPSAKANVKKSLNGVSSAESPSASEAEPYQLFLSSPRPRCDGNMETAIMCDVSSPFSASKKDGDTLYYQPQEEPI